MALDLEYNRYELPIFVINDPEEYSKVTFSSRNLRDDVEENSEETIEIIVRCAKLPNEDTVLNVAENCSIQ